MAYEHDKERDVEYSEGACWLSSIDLGVVGRGE